MSDWPAVLIGLLAAVYTLYDPFRYDHETNQAATNWIAYNCANTTSVQCTDWQEQICYDTERAPLKRPADLEC